MFQNLRQNTQIYILHKDSNPYLETGSVVSIVGPKPKYPVPGPVGQIPGIETVVDITVAVNGQNVTFQGIPSNLEIADSFKDGNVVITASRDAMNAEVNSMRSKSEGIIGSVDMHRGIVQACDRMLSELNPEYAERQKQEREMAEMRSQINSLTSGLSELMEANRRLMEQLQGSETAGRTSTKKTN